MSAKQFQFVVLSHPSENATWKSTVRSKAARGPRNRQKRTVPVPASAPRGRANKQMIKSATGESSNHDDNSGQWSCYSPVTVLQSSALSVTGGFSHLLSDHEAFLVKHFLNIIIPQPPFCRARDSSTDSADLRKSLAKEWLGQAASDTSTLTAILLLSCQNLSAIHGKKDYATLAMKYRSECMRDVAQDLEVNGLKANELTFAKIIVLLCDSAMGLDNEASVAHIHAAHEMVVSRQKTMGPETSIFYRRLMEWFMQSEVTAIDRIERPVVDVQA
ncbi:hypothetical protein LZ32DRAFT_609555 [Colletotrichum eremochloae]|nr:hypothetical protein LZ32DRAFT_609555 [Colletotrichum eremochloae]